MTPSALAFRGYRLPAWSPPRPPAFRPAAVVLGQAATMAQKGAAAVVMLVPTALAGAVAYVGFRAGSRDKGFPQVLGYGVGVLGGLGVLAGFLSVLGIVTLPSKPVY